MKFQTLTPRYLMHLSNVFVRLRGLSKMQLSLDCLVSNSRYVWLRLGIDQIRNRSSKMTGFRSGLKLVKVQSDLKSITTRGSMQSLPIGHADHIQIWQFIRFRSGSPNSIMCNDPIILTPDKSNRFQIWQDYKF